MKPKRVLVIINSMNVGGAETFVMKVFRAINRQKIVFDFLVNTTSAGAYHEEIIRMGGNIYFGTAKTTNPFKNFLGIYSLVKDNQYEAVISIAVHPLAAFDLLAAKLGGAKIRMVRSTTSNVLGRAGARVLAGLGRPLMRMLSTHRLAPSVQASKWLFGSSGSRKKVYIVPNGLHLDEFRYDIAVRNRIRAELNIEGQDLVIGHIGRFSRVKNHHFLVMVFREVLALCPKARLLLVGDGELRAEVKKEVKELHIEDKVIFTGVRSDIPNILMAMDLMVFPSLYEGMPNAVIEAQATGLPCLISDTITEEVAITDLVTYISLAETPESWAQKVFLGLGSFRMDRVDEMRDKGYSITKSAEIFTELLVHLS